MPEAGPSDNILIVTLAPPTPPVFAPATTDRIARVLAAIFPPPHADFFTLHPAERHLYRSDGLTLAAATPAAVVFPQTTDQAARVITALAAEGIAVVCRGAGTGLAGGVAPLNEAVLISTARMNRVLSVDAPNRVAHVQAGVRNTQLTESLAASPATSWLHFAPDPSSQRTATIGGNAATNAGGVHTLKDFTTSNHVLGIEMVLPDGTVLTTGGQSGASQNSPFDLTGLLCGSEGTLGLITSLWVRLSARPTHFRTAVAAFADSQAACCAVSAIIGSGMMPAALEMMDGVMIDVIRNHGGLLLPAAAALLLLELDGPPELTAHDMAAARTLMSGPALLSWEESDDPATRQKLWKARKNAFGAIGHISRSYCTQDACVPRSALAEVLAFIHETGRRYGLQIPNVFHAGDGNIHPIFLFDDREPEQVTRALSAAADILKFCVSLGGTLTGEHGIGLEKVHLMAFQFDAESLEALNDVKWAFDPSAAFNRGKLLPDSRVTVTLASPGRNVAQ